jgi:hypothetical protein
MMLTMVSLRSWHTDTQDRSISLGIQERTVAQYRLLDLRQRLSHWLEVDHHSPRLEPTKVWYRKKLAIITGYHNLPAVRRDVG